MWQACAHRQDFNPRSSCEERPFGAGHDLLSIHYFNPRSSCEERQRLLLSPLRVL